MRPFLLLVLVSASGCLGGGGGGGLCTPAPGGAPCCEPPPMPLACPEGTMLVETRESIVQQGCEDADGKRVGPYVATTLDGKARNYGESGVHHVTCNQDTGWVRLIQDSDPGGSNCTAGAWDDEGNPVELTNPCPE